MFETHSIPPGKVIESVKVDMEPTIFAIAKDRVTISPEFGHIGSCR